ncbi:solute carrier family 23 member 3 isoform X3 [Numida meleagris]|uniref:solute carrier family 23 member 3 isoform X3 n=1 Tax=Numida meleagris TaxID=8996 RepID=UPI000B3DEDF6|nr:solute carrier family 23 member 3 isoform X3 [Numida meleagris]XP_021254342.1 solute carrier family 23 member 3 isoform X3 [Numida meleagris]
MLSVYSVLSHTGLWGCAGLWAGPAGAGSSGCVRLGSAALWAHGPGPQPLYHRTVHLQGGCFLLLCQLGGRAAVRQPGSHAGLQPCALPCHRDRKEASPQCKAHIWGPVSMMLRGDLCLFPGSCSSPSPSPSTWGPAACPSVPGLMPQGSPWSHLSPPCALSRFSSPLPLSALSALSSATSISPGTYQTWRQHSFPGSTTPFTPHGSRCPMQVRLQGWVQLSSLGNVTCPLSSSAGEWPLLTPRALAVGIAMAFGCSINSVGCYVLCGRLLRAPQPPPHTCNRGLCIEGLGSLLAGLLGSAGGTAASITNACAGGLTQDGSRLSVQLSALVCVMLGMSPRLVGLLAHIPLAVHGGVLCVTYAVAVGTGISYFQYADIDSGRNIFIVGFTMFMALLVPRWLSVAPARLVTGWVPLDLLFLSLLMMPVFLTGFLSFFLENTVSGTLEERGLLADHVQWKPGTSAGQPRRERGKASPVYGLPTRLRRLLPSSCKAFPCCFLCPGSEDEKEEEEEDSGLVAEEGRAAVGEGTHLLLKPGTGEMQADRRPSQAEMLAWHTGA